MTDPDKYQRLPDDPCITGEVFFDYIDGKLSPSEMHKVEAHVNDCAMCSDALEGLTKVKDRDKAAGYWNTTVGKTIGEETGKVISIWRKPSLYYSAAACIVLLLGFVFMKNFISEDGVGNKTAQLEDTERMMDSSSSPSADSMMIDRQSALDKSQTADVPAETRTLDKTSSGNTSQNGPETSASGGTNTHGEGSFSGIDQNTQLDNSVNDLPKQAEQENRVVLDDQINFSNTERDDQNIVLQQANSEDARNNKGKNKPNKKDAAKDEAPASSTQQPRANASASGATNTNNDGDVLSSNTVTNNQQANTNVASNSEAQQTYDQMSDSTRTEQDYHPLKESDKDIELSYNTGVQMLSQNKAEQSLVFFNDVLNYPQNIHFEDAQWKKVEALIQLGRKTEAKELLNKIITAGGKYKTQAAEKLKTL